MLLTNSQRTLAFWGVCIPTRLYIATLARDTKYKDVLRVAAALVAATWLSGMTKRVGFFGGRAWWSEERRLHGALWGAYALVGDWRFLLADVLFGAGNWIAKH
jgi:hypothetical protein